jgi:hypothetical protein
MYVSVVQALMRLPDESSAAWRRFAHINSVAAVAPGLARNRNSECEAIVNLRLSFF